MTSDAVVKSGGNVFEDIGIKDAEGMLRKAKLVSSIQDIIEGRGWTQRQAAKVLGISQPKLSLMLRGQFHGISETQILRYLARLGSNVRIVVTPPVGINAAPGNIQVVFA